jgi:predicted dehydrogenase
MREEETYGHTPARKALELGDVYGIGYDEERAARKPLRLGMIGCGGVAQSKYLPAIARLRVLWEPVTLVAFAEPVEQQAQKVLGIYGGRWYRDYRQLLAHEELDGVLVLSPDEWHAEHTLAALEAGLHTLVEKPIARSLVEAETMCRRADERGLILMTVANKRYSPPYRQAKRLLGRGGLAAPALFIGKFTLGYDYVDLLEAGTIHLFDLARYLMGDVSTVSAVAVNKYHRQRRPYPLDNAVMALEFSAGAVGTLATSATALSFKPWERVEVYGDHAWLVVEDQYTLTLYESEEGPAQRWTGVIPHTLLFDEEFGGYLGLVENFLQAMRGAERPLVNGWDGYRAYELNVACHLSLAGHGKVSLPLVPREADAEVRAWLRRGL